jgi:hypothetical protein
MVAESDPTALFTHREGELQAEITKCNFRIKHYLSLRGHYVNDLKDLRYEYNSKMDEDYVPPARLLVSGPWSHMVLRNVYFDDLGFQPSPIV